MMKVVRIMAMGLVFAALTAVCAGRAWAQRSYSFFTAGPHLGSCHYQGDLDDNGFDWWAVLEGGKENRKIGNPLDLLRPGIGFSVYYHFLPRFLVRAQFNQGWIAAADSFNDSFGRRWRNQHFRSPVTELSAHLVYEVFPTYDPLYRKRWSPYFFAGVGVFFFNPKAKPDPQWLKDYPEYFQDDRFVELQPLGTEGQFLVPQIDPLTGQIPQYPKPYSLTQICIPFGAGVRWKISPKFDMRFDIGLRKLFTDYLDDVSGIDYPNYEEMMAYNPVAALFSDRSGYINDYSTRGVSASLVQRLGGREFGEKRGNPKRDDWYAFVSLGVTMLIYKPDRCPKYDLGNLFGR
jgi:hypothetical protein